MPKISPIYFYLSGSAIDQFFPFFHNLNIHTLTLTFNPFMYNSSRLQSIKPIIAPFGFKLYVNYLLLISKIYQLAKQKVFKDIKIAKAYI